MQAKYTPRFSTFWNLGAAVNKWRILFRIWPLRWWVGVSHSSQSPLDLIKQKKMVIKPKKYLTKLLSINKPLTSAACSGLESIISWKSLSNAVKLDFSNRHSFLSILRQAAGGWKRGAGKLNKHELDEVIRSGLTWGCCKGRLGFTKIAVTFWITGSDPNKVPIIGF